MADIIYTGKGAAQVLQGGGQSLQALGQFSAQQQQIKRDELSKAIKDQDTFLKMLDIDEVYTAFQNANKEIASSISGFVDKWGDIYRQKGGQLATSDLAEMQKGKAAVVAKMNYLKQNSDEVLKSYELASRNPDEYSVEKVRLAAQQFGENLIRPEGGYLYPAYKDPRQMLSQVSDREPQEVPERMYKDGRWYDAVVKAYPEVTDKDREQKAVQLYKMNPWDFNGWVEEWAGMEDDKREEYRNVAEQDGYESGLEAYIAKEGSPYLYQEKTDVRRSQTDYIARAQQQRAAKDWVVNSTGVYDDDGNPMAIYSENMSELGGEYQGQGLYIQGEGVEINVAGSDIVTASEDINFSPKEQVQVIPKSIIKTSKGSFVIGRPGPGTKEITYTTTSQSEAYKDAKGGYRIYENINGKKGNEVSTDTWDSQKAMMGEYIYEYKKRPDENVTLIVPYKGGIVQQLNLPYRSKISQYWNEYMIEKKPKVKWSPK